MIPKIISFFWGGSPLSWMRYMTLASFRRLNPSWEMRLYHPVGGSRPRSWKSRELDDGEYCGENYLPRMLDLGVRMAAWQPPLPGLSGAHACDLFEWQQLSTVGGFYSDMDIIYVRPIDGVYESVRDADVVLSCADRDLAIGFLAARPDCPLFASVLGEALNCYRPEAYQSAGTEALYRAARIWPVNLVRIPETSAKAIQRFRSIYPSLKIAEVPSTTVYPYYWKTAPRIYDHTELLPPETIGIHWYGGLRESQVMNDLLTEENFQDHPCTFTHYAGRHEDCARLPQQ